MFKALNVLVRVYEYLVMNRSTRSCYRRLVGDDGNSSVESDTVVHSSTVYRYQYTTR